MTGGGANFPITNWEADDPTCLRSAEGKVLPFAKAAKRRQPNWQTNLVSIAAITWPKSSSYQ
jgi:hypothetical protein